MTPLPKIFLALAVFFGSQLVLFNAHAKEKMFYFRISHDPGTLDWNYGEVNALVVNQLMEGLTRITPQGKVVGTTAQDWLFHQEKKVLKFYLKKGLKWSDGSELCVKDYMDSWLRVLDPKVKSPYAHYLFDIKNAKKYFLGELPESEVGINADSCHELTINFERSSPHFISIASHWITFPIKKEKLQSLGENYFRPENLPVNGPFRLTEWKINRFLTLESNPNYHGEKPKFNKIRAIVVEDDLTALNLFRTHALHWMKDLPYLNAQELKTNPAYKTMDTLVEYFVGFNTTSHPFNDTQLRCSLMYSLDKSKLPEILGGEQVPLVTWVPQTLYGTPEKNTLPTDLEFSVEKAQQYFNKSSFSKNENKEKLEFHYYTKDIHQPLALWLQNQWKTNLKINVELVPHEPKSYWSLLEKTPPALFLSGTTAWFLHPYAFLSEFMNKSTPNWGKFHSSRYDLLSSETLKTKSPETLARTVADAETELLKKECAIIPLYRRKTPYLINTNCSGEEVNSLAVFNFSKVQCQF